MTPAEQASLPLTRVGPHIHERHARHALSLLDKAVEAFGGAMTTNRVSTMTLADDVRQNTRLVVTHTDNAGDMVHATVVMDESVHISRVPLPRTSRDQAVWVRDMVRSALDAPVQEPPRRHPETATALHAYGMIDAAGADQCTSMTIDRTAATPLGTGGVHVTSKGRGLSLSDHDDGSTMPGPVDMAVSYRMKGTAPGTTTIIRIEAHSHSTPVPMADAVERLRMMMDADVDMGEEA